MNTSYLIFLALYLLGLLVRTGYERLKQTGRIKSSKPAFAVVFAAMFLLWASWFNLCPLDPWPVARPDWLRGLGFGAFIGGLALAIGALVQLRGLENVNRLVTGGLFARVRHPMYAGFILWIPGWALYHGAMLSLLAGLVGIANILYWQQLEEQELESRYGATYRTYRQQTWF
ncbi:MAG: isoprenylcysteine carboxylmethyltransferase family protein [Chloroflexota bacterium]